MSQEPLFDLPGPHTGRSHPHTSWEAAKQTKYLVAKKRLEVLLAFAAQGRMTDERLRAYLNKSGTHSESGPRARRSELVDAHLVEAVGESRNEAGNKVLIWDLSQEGRNFLEDGGLWTFRSK
jgi:hypothetical protein